MQRRGILGWFGAAAVASAAPADPASVGRYIPARLRPGVVGAATPETDCGVLGPCEPWSEADAKAFATLERRLRGVEARISQRRYARDRLMDLCGGHAPHIAPCRSWAPWFKAQASIRWQLAQEKAAHAEEIAQSRSLASGIKSLVVEALPQWMRDKLDGEDA